jgi:hypothetical protein
MRAESNAALPRCMAFVQGYAVGAATAAMEIGRRSGVPSRTLALFCPPEGVTLKQLQDVVARGLFDAPQARHLLANTLVFLILAQAFACSTGR